MKKFLILVAAFIFTFMYSDSQDLKGTYWEIAAAQENLTSGHKWVIKFESDTTFKFIEDFAREYPYNLLKKTINLLKQDVSCTFSLHSENEISVNCSGEKLKGKQLSPVEIKECLKFRGKHIAIDLPYSQDKDLLNSKDPIGKWTSIVNIYMSPFYKNKKNRKYLSEDAAIQVHFADQYTSMNGIRKYSNTRLNDRNLIFDQFPNHNKTQDSYVILYIDKDMLCEDINAVLWRISEISSIKSVYFAIEKSNDYEFEIVYKKLDNNHTLNYLKSKFFYNWVELGFPTLKPGTEIIEIIDIMDDSEDEIEFE